MVPIYKARGLADGRHQELPAGPGTLNRLALRVAGWGRRPAAALRPAALLPRAYRPSVI
jgi:hypothetical protein